MEFGVINIINTFIVFFILAPNIIFMKTIRFREEKCQSRIIILIEQITRYLCMILMIIPFYTMKFGFSSVEAFIFFLYSVPVCIILYYVFWVLYVKKMTLFKAIMLSVLPVMIFVITGFCLMHIPLIITSMIFGVCHIYISYVNNK